MSHGEIQVTSTPTSARAIALLAIAAAVAVAATVMIAGIWLHLGGRSLGELAAWLAGSSSLALVIGTFLLWVVDRAADGRFVTRLTISGILTSIVLILTAVPSVWRLYDAGSDRRLLWLLLAFATTVAGIFTVMAAWFDARPLQNLAAGATSIAGGHYGARLAETGNAEIAQTSEAVNLLAARAQSSAIRKSNQDRVRESLLLAIAADAQVPIDSLRSITQSMASGADGEPVVTRRHLEALDRETANLQNRIDEIEEIARLESGQVTLRMQPVSLAQLVIAVCDRLQPRASTRDIAIGPRVDFSAPRVLVDPEQTLRALESLVAYALSETPDGGRLSVEMRESGPMVQLALLDLPGDEPFDTATRIQWESAHRRRESALSLAVAGRLIEAQGGSFLISRGNPGAPMVIVSLPRS